MNIRSLRALLNGGSRGKKEGERVEAERLFWYYRMSFDATINLRRRFELRRSANKKTQQYSQKKKKRGGRAGDRDLGNTVATGTPPVRQMFS